MSKSPNCPRCKEKLVIPNATTWREFLNLAGPIYRATRPQREKAKRPRGRPFDPNSTFAKLANELVRKEVTRVDAQTKASPAVDRWASSPDTVDNLTNKLVAKLAEQNSHPEPFMIRRAVKLALINKKRIRALTDEDLNLLRQRQKITVRKLEYLIRDTASVFQLMINARDNPTSQEDLTTAIREATRLTARIQRARTVSK